MFSGYVLIEKIRRYLCRPEGQEPLVNTRRQWFYAFLLLGILVVAGVLRFAQLGEFELWLDECCSVCTITSPAGILADLRQDNNPPLYFFLLKLWTKIFGIFETGARSLSVVLSLLQLAALGFWVRRIGMPAPAAVAACFIAALTPLHWYYSREARPYMLLLLFITTGLWSIASAMTTGRRSAWVAHAASVIAGIHTHDLYLPMIAVMWLQAALLSRSRRRWRELAICYAFVLVAYAPWLIRVANQPKSEALSWVATTWKSTPPILALPRSFEAFTIGGLLPPYLRQPAFSHPVRVGALFTFGVFILLSIVKLAMGPPRRRVQLSVALAAMLVPLMLIYAYSWIRQPIYVVGRYDIIALPGFFALTGFGAFWLWRLLARLVRTLALAVPIAIAVLATAAFYPLFFHEPADRHANFQTERGVFLAGQVRAGDVLVCTGLEGAKVAVQMLRHNIPADLITFPLDTRQHFGWLHPRHTRPGAEAHLVPEANQVMSMIGQRRQYRRAWILSDPARALQTSATDPFVQLLVQTASRWAVQQVKIPRPGTGEDPTRGVRLFQ